ncbi:hypothetical protein KSP39_PZI020330 [Platanthera zijinensis]|uniref:Anaphase-promoting complex subunit 4 WD40 domain-containing protein n=1 Tax=Platanthera zijinensis TaxID=2320716 RepID=A0AAP0AZU1_9ASPA
MNFRFQNILGAPYRGGNAVISDYSLLSPVGNRVSVTELIKSQTITLPFEATCNISRIALSPDGNFLLTVDDQSRALFVNLSRRVVLHRISFKKGVTALRFSSDGSLIAVGLGKLLQIWRSPGFRKEFFPSNLCAHSQIVLPQLRHSTGAPTLTILLSDQRIWRFGYSF